MGEPPTREVVDSGSEEETLELGRRLADRLSPDGLLLLYGDLGSGKTVLVTGIASGLGIDPKNVQSPTFTLIHEYLVPTARGADAQTISGKSVRLVHVDLYRLSPAEVPALGLEEILLGPGIKVVEWAERWPFDETAMTVRFERLDENRRRLVIEQIGL